MYQKIKSATFQFLGRLVEKINLSKFLAKFVQKTWFVGNCGTCVQFGYFDGACRVNVSVSSGPFVMINLSQDMTPKISPHEVLTFASTQTTTNTVW